MTNIYLFTNQSNAFSLMMDWHGDWDPCFGTILHVPSTRRMTPAMLGVYIDLTHLDTQHVHLLFVKHQRKEELRIFFTLILESKNRGAGSWNAWFVTLGALWVALDEIGQDHFITGIVGCAVLPRVLLYLFLAHFFDEISPIRLWICWVSRYVRSMGGKFGN